MDPTFSVVLPTIGRPGLEATLNSLVASGFTAGDQLVLLPDGDDQRGVTRRALRCLRQEEWADVLVAISCMEGSGGDYGQPGRNRGMAAASGDFVVFTQDDQVFLSGALQRLRTELAAPDATRQVHFVQVVPTVGYVVPRAPALLGVGQIDADCLVLPTARRDLWAHWGVGYNGDHTMIAKTYNNFRGRGGGAQWHMFLVSVNERHLAHYGGVP